MIVRIALVHSDRDFLKATERAMPTVQFAITPFDNTIEAWNGLKTGEFEVLVARVDSPRGTPNGVALALGGNHANPRLRTVLITHDSEVEHAEGLGELLPPTIRPDELAGYLIQRFGQIKEAA